MKKVLHITNWYPNKWDNLNAIFIQEQFKVFSDITDSHLINVQVRNSNKIMKYEYIKYSSNEEGYYLFTKIKSNKVIELLTTFLLLWVLFKSNYKKYNLLHFHIAYPLLIHYFLWKKIIKIPLIISEHWSAYHFNFYMPWETKKLDVIKRIFKHNITLITVSKALLEDIQKFSNSYNFKHIVIPNVIKQNIFYYHHIQKRGVPTFFIVNGWSKIKNPFPMLEAFSKLETPFILKIGGYGDFYQEIKNFIKLKKMEEKTIIFEKMTSEEIAEELNNSDAYLFSSTYETFSIICAEALSCGCPIIGPPIPAILEYTDKNNSLLIPNNDVISWIKGLEMFIKNQHKFNRLAIANKAKKYFSDKTIKKRYNSLIDEVFSNDK